MDLVYFGMLVLVAVAIGRAVARTGEPPSTPPAARTWRIAARRLGLAVREGQGSYRWRMSGTYEGMTIKVDYQRPLNEDRSLPATAAAQHNLYSVWSEEIPQKLHVMSRRRASTAGVRRPELDTGDPVFDREVFLHGVETCTLAVLDAETRGQLLEFVRRWDGEIRLGALTIDDRRVSPTPEEVVEKVRALYRLAQRLVLRGRTVPALLDRNAGADPLRAVRHRNLEALLVGFPEAAEAAAACARVLGAPSDPEFRLLAACSAGAAGHPHLEALVADATSGEAVRAGALAAIVERFPRTRALALAYAAFSGDSPVLRRAAIRAYGKLHHLPALGAVLACARDLEGPDAETAEAAAEALGELGERAAETALTDLLRHRAGFVRAAAVRALGRVGSPAAIQPLLELTRLGVLGAPAEARTAVHEAIAAIRKRFGVEVAQAGRLTVFAAGAGDDAVGALSVAHDPGGALSPVAGAPRPSPGSGAVASMSAMPTLAPAEPTATGDPGGEPAAAARPRAPCGHPPGRTSP